MYKCKDTLANTESTGTGPRRIDTFVYLSVGTSGTWRRFPDFEEGGNSVPVQSLPLGVGELTIFKVFRTEHDVGVEVLDRCIVQVFPPGVEYPSSSPLLVPWNPEEGHVWEGLVIVLAVWGRAVADTHDHRSTSSMPKTLDVNFESIVHMNSWFLGQS